MIAIAGHSAGASGTPIVGETMALAVGYGAWFALCVTWFWARYKDWMLCYLLPGDEAPDWLAYPLFVTSLVLASASGYALAAALLHQGLDAAAWAAAALGGLTWLGALLLTWDRYVHIGTYAGYHAGDARPLREHREFRTEMNVATPVLFAPFVTAVAWLVVRG